MRTATKICKVALTIQRQFLFRRNILNNLCLVLLANSPKKINSVVSTHQKSLDFRPLGSEHFHPGLDALKISF